MKSNDQVYIRDTRSFFPGTSDTLIPPGGSPYPGLGGGEWFGGGGFPTPYQGGVPAAGTGTGLGFGLGGAPAAAGAAAGAGAGGSGINFAQLKGFVDRMGGIDGIVSTMTRVQKMVSSFQQVAPMVKLLMGSFGAKAAAAGRAGDGLAPVRRRKKRRPVNGTRRPVRSSPRSGSANRSGSRKGKRR